MSKRQEKAADKEAAAIMASLARAGSAAVDQALAEVVETLTKDPPLLYHINALLKSEEWRGVLKGALSGDDATGEKPAGSEDLGRKLRTGMKKFNQLTRPRGPTNWQACLGSSTTVYPNSRSRDSETQLPRSGLESTVSGALLRNVCLENFVPTPPLLPKVL